MDINQIGSMLLCLTCIFLMPGHALEFNADVAHELFTRKMDDVMFENRLLKTKLEEVVRKMENQADRKASLEKVSAKIEKQAEKLASLEEVKNRMENQAGRLTNLEKNTNKTEKQAEKIASLEEVKNRMESQAGGITNLEEATNKMQIHADQLNVAYGEIQQLKTRIMKMETRQGRRAAFLATYSPHQSNGIICFLYVRLNEGSVYNSSTGEFTCPFPGIYAFTATITEGGGGDNYIFCFIMKNDFDYVYMISRQGKIDGKRATRGFGTATGAATLHLVKGDRVAVYCTNFTGNTLRSSSFSGFLVSADS